LAAFCARRQFDMARKIEIRTLTPAKVGSGRDRK
jgi:hypothetical protein